MPMSALLLLSTKGNCHRFAGILNELQLIVLNSQYHDRSFGIGRLYWSSSSWFRRRQVFS